MKQADITNDYINIIASELMGDVHDVLLESGYSGHNLERFLVRVLFQCVMDKDARRNFGAHYTTEENILKLIRPLFMDELRAEFAKCKSNKNKLLSFHEKLVSH